MSYSRIGLLFLVLLSATSTPGQPAISLDILDASDPGGPAPAGVLVVDICLDVSETEAFLTGAITGRAFNGGRLLYYDEDPNSVFRPPGLEHPFVTFGNAGYARDDPARFAPAGTLEEPSIALFPYDTHGPQSIFTSNEVNTGFRPSPFPPLRLGVDGCPLRVALDISNVILPGADDIENYRIFAPGEEPEGYSPVFVSTPRVFTDIPGTAFVVHPQGAPFGVDWGIYVPEPGTVFMLMIGLLTIRRRSVLPRRRLTASALLALIGGQTANGQPTIGNQLRIDAGPGVSQTNETAVAAAEINPLVAVAAWNDWQFPRLDAGATTNGGLTWQEYPIPGQPKCGFDPMAAADPLTGELWVGGASHADVDGCEDYIWVARWNGAGFDPAVNISGFIPYADKPLMAIGRVPGIPNSTRLYVVYYGNANADHFIKWSDSMGVAGSWQGPVQLPSTPNGVKPNGTLPRVGPNGELYVLASEQNGFGIWLYRWIWQFGQPTIPQFSTPISVATRLDTWPHSDTDRIPGVFRAPAWSYVAVDPVSGILYVVYFDTTKKVELNGITSYDLDIYFTTSGSQGAPGSWSTPAIISQPDSAPYDQFFPWIEVDANQRIHMIFYDTLGSVHADNDVMAELRVRYAYSENGGASWTETTISPLWSGQPATWPDGFSGFIGDYLGLAATTSRIYPVYMATYGPQQQPPLTPNQNIYSNVIIWP